jgi:hypothetical protein
MTDVRTQETKQEKEKRPQWPNAGLAQLIVVAVSKESKSKIERVRLTFISSLSYTSIGIPASCFANSSSMFHGLYTYPGAALVFVNGAPVTRCWKAFP